MFNYDWFHGQGLLCQIEEAKRRCAIKRFPDQERAKGKKSEEYTNFVDELDTRIILYLKDGLSYEMREIAEIGTSSALAFECVPVDENYAVGAYVIIVPFEDISRVEVYAVHPEDKPVESLRIPGFRTTSSDSNR